MASLFASLDRGVRLLAQLDLSLSSLKDPRSPGRTMQETVAASHPPTLGGYKSVLLYGLSEIASRIKSRLSPADPAGASNLEALSPSYPAFRARVVELAERTTQEMSISRQPWGAEVDAKDKSNPMFHLGTLPPLLSTAEIPSPSAPQPQPQPKSSPLPLLLDCLSPLTAHFVEAASSRLLTLLSLMFPSLPPSADTLPPLPSKFDVKALAKAYEKELGRADPASGGERGMVPMMAEVVGTNVSLLAERASLAVSTRSPFLNADFSPTESFRHNLSLSSLLSLLQKSLERAPSETFLAPHQPTVPAAQYAAADECSQLLQKLALDRLARLLEHRVYVAIADPVKDKLGAFLAGGTAVESVEDVFGQIKTKLIDTLTSPEARKLTTTSIALFATNFFTSNLAITKTPPSQLLDHLNTISQFEIGLSAFCDNFEAESEECGRAHRELRALKQLVAWGGWDRPLGETTGAELRREAWSADLRKSTVMHFLFNFSDDLLSSPHHHKGVRAEEYVGGMVREGGGGEATAKEVVLSCIDEWRGRRGGKEEVVAGISAIAAAW
ncbi:hypothetical protein TeGR_g8826 [Tetraparma gracilis]|uniref:Uncharacterized protein n=1 Tax=Tetraparma gracilis TaxID=2962635 RepID=A0ABQ6M4T5_9STRA|nr:hypothetical protein TeGR_g8826 [Tetraparma gracilis]